MTMIFALALTLTTQAADVKSQINNSIYETESNVPSRSKRIFALEKAGLMEEAAKMDELDQDLFYFRAKTKSKKGLAQLYPQLNKEKLESFQSFIKERK